MNQFSLYSSLCVLTWCFLFSLEKLRVCDQSVQEEGGGQCGAEETTEGHRRQEYHVHAAEPRSRGGATSCHMTEGWGYCTVSFFSVGAAETECC